MLKVLIETSIFVLLLRKSRSGYCCIEQWLDKTYRNSQIYKIIKEIWGRIKTYFRYSFLGKVTELTEEENFVIAQSSAVVQWLISLYKKWAHKLVSYFKSSKTDNLIRQLKKDFCFLPIKTISIIIIGAIITNIIFFVLLKKEIGLLGWVIRGLLLFVGFGGLFCNANWEDIKKTSAIFQLIYQRQSVNIQEK